MCRLAWHFCVRSEYEPGVAFNLIRSGVADCGREVPDREINRAIALATGSAPNRQGESSLAWPKPDAGKVRQLVEEYPTFDVEALRQHSSNQINGYGMPYSVLERLFYPKALVCAGTEFDKAETRSLESYIPLDRKAFQFVVPNPMSKRSGRSQDGHPSIRCLDATGPRRWLVIECDFKKEDDCGNPTIWAPLIEEWAKAGLTVKDASARILRHLTERQYPLVMVVDSGGKSLHGWFWVKDEPESKVRAFMSEAATLGADTHLYVMCQWARFPGGYRPDKQKNQDVIYFRPESIPGPNPRKL
jgi:hypothetical protein